MRPGLSHLYPYLSLRSSNSGWQGNWFYILDDASAMLLPFFYRSPSEVGFLVLGVRQEAIDKGGGDLGGS